MVVLETERMLLREMDMNDVENLQGIFADPEAMRYYPKTKSVAETEEWIRWNMSSYRVFRFGLWIALLKENCTFAGQCGLVMQRVDDLPEVKETFMFNKQLCVYAFHATASEHSTGPS